MYKILKRMLDIVFSCLLIVLFLPIMLIISCAIAIDSPGAVLFRQTRLGLAGNPFMIYKFRTMVENAEKMGTGLFNYEDDFRVTKVGSFLRLTSLDELPQLFNILIGDMSFVGPRPPVSYELGNYEDLNDQYKRRFTILPGVTGLAQVSGRNELSWDEKVKYDNQYIDLMQKWTILIDTKIVILTIIKVLKMEGSYEIKEEEEDKNGNKDKQSKPTNLG